MPASCATLRNIFVTYREDSPPNKLVVKRIRDQMIVAVATLKA